MTRAVVTADDADPGEIAERDDAAGAASQIIEIARPRRLVR
jgi:hypothetical protein